MIKVVEEGRIKFKINKQKQEEQTTSPTVYKDQVERVMMEFVNRDIACKEELFDLDKKQLVKMLYEIGNDVDYWNFAIDNAIFS